MRITLIMPRISIAIKSTLVSKSQMQPLQLGILAALIPGNIDIRLYDDRIESISFDEPTDAVFITVETFTAKRAYEIADEYSKRNVPIIMGGIHVRLATTEVSEHCDSVVSGDAENILLEIIEDLRNNSLKPVYSCDACNPPQANLFPNRNIFLGKKYLPISLVQFSRGCIHNCYFCASSAYFNQKHYCRDVKEVIEEIKLQKHKFIFFVDDNLIAEKDKAKELLEALIPLKIRWVSQGTINMVYDKELMTLMVKSGCIGFIIGLESISPESIAFMGKTINKKGNLEKYRTEIAILRKWGLQTWATFTIGHDTDTVESIIKTVDWTIENKLTFATFNTLVPYPGTQLYAKLEAENRLLYNGKWWLADDYSYYHAAFLPKNMTPDELTNVSLFCRKKFTSMGSKITRLFEPKTNMRSLLRFAIYLACNPIFERTAI